MQSQLDTFGKTARDLARNPLGIIALFIVLIYGFPALLMGNTATDLTPGQGYILIVFLSTFPVLVLLIFAWLVANHHAKLYAPADYKSDEAFLQTLTSTENQRRLEREIEEESVAPVSTQDSTTVPTEPEQEQRREMTRGLIHGARMVEDLVFQKLESETDAPVHREVKILGTGNLGILGPRPESC
jgi:hypothetical protein